MAGVTRIKVSGEEGTIVRIKHGERIYDNGRVNTSNIDVYHRPVDDSDPFQTDILILSGKGEDEFMPRFNYKGFRYVEVTSNKPITLNENSLTAYFTHSDVPQKGEINTSNTLINRLWWTTNNAYLSNLMGYPTDCPQREKMDGPVTDISRLKQHCIIMMVLPFTRNGWQITGTNSSLMVYCPILYQPEAGDMEQTTDWIGPVRLQSFHGISTCFMVTVNY